MPTETLLSNWRSHLADEFLRAQVPRNPRNGIFDMDDGPDLPLLKTFPQLQTAFQYLQAALLPLWRVSDSAAMKYQRQHRILARTVIGTGTAAVVLAILQMAVRQTPSLVTPALTLEILAVMAGTVAVAVGLWTKGDRHWLCERNRAERLRILKFKALGWSELWSQDMITWKQRLKDEIDPLKQSITEEDVRYWSENERPEPEPVFATSGPLSNGAELTALKTYFQIKRLTFQSHYYENSFKQQHAAAQPWRHLSLPIFLLSNVCILIHFTADWLLADARNHLQPSMAQIWESVEIWSLALAAIVPVIGLGIRVWLGAFEPHRSANLHRCKHQTVENLRKQMHGVKDEPQAWFQHVAEVEKFFESEHREWLRLMLETEWRM